MLCSDDKYQEFQADQNLQYKCAACRGDCYQVCLLFARFYFGHAWYDSLMFLAMAMLFR